MAQIISIINQKGGVGKTTTAINLAACLAAAEHPTLLVDLDPQSNATSGVGISPRVERLTIQDTLLGETPVHEIALKTGMPGLQLLPASQDLSGAELALADSGEGRLLRLRDVLKPIGRDFDFIVIDAPPSLSLLTLNVLAASQHVIVPVQCEYYALEGLSTMLTTFQRVSETVNPDMRILGILMTMFDKRTNLGQQVVDEVRRVFANQVFETVVPRSVKLSEAPSFGKPIIYYDVRSSGAEAYIQLCEEVLQRVKESRVGQGA